MISDYNSQFPNTKKPELLELPQIKERISFLYLEHAVINGADSAISVTDERGFSNADDLQDDSYVVIDIETTGLSPKWAEIAEIGAIKVVSGKIVSKMQSLIKIKKRVPPEITKLTGITDKMLAMDGKPLNDVMVEFLAFIGDLPLVAHNSRFDLSFINAALGQMQQPKLSNRIIDTLALSKRLLKSLESYKLGELSSYFGHKPLSFDENDNSQHRSLGDCYLTYLLYQKLLNLD